VSWLKKFLNTSPSALDAPSPSTGFFDIEGQPVPLSIEGQDVKTARELIRAAALRTASAFGIPPQWVSYEVVTISDDDKAYFQLQVSLRIWDEQLWAQSSAFEQQALKRIREDDVNVARAVRAVLWRILPDAGCPHDELAGAEAWRPEAVKVRGAAYEKLRATLQSPLPNILFQAAAPAGLPSGNEVETEPSVASTGFGQTLPMGHLNFDHSESPASGFAATRPFTSADELPPIRPR
jgi:hypothetical protein